MRARDIKVKVKKDKNPYTTWPAGYFKESNIKPLKLFAGISTLLIFHNTEFS